MQTLIRHQIERAFPTHPKPGANAAVESTYGVEHLHERLAGRPWTEPSVDDYRCCDDGLRLLTVPGLHYYLPGYLTAELKDPNAADVIAEGVTYVLGDHSAMAQQRLNQLGHLMILPQIVAIGLWLGYYVQTYGSNQHVRRSYATLDAWATKALNAEGRAVRSRIRPKKK